MIEYVIIEGESLALILAPPDWNTPVSVSPSLPTAIEETLTGAEQRATFAAGLLHTVSYRPALDGDELRNFKIQLNQLRDQRCALPWWPERRLVSGIVGSAVTLADAAGHSCSLFILIDAAGNYEIVEGDRDTQTTTLINLTAAPSIVPEGELFIAPLLFGRARERPEIVAFTDEGADITLQFDEDNQFSARLHPLDTSWVTAGSAIAAFSSTNIFPLRPDFIAPMTKDKIVLALSGMGFGRENETAYHAAHPRRGLTMRFTLQDAEISRLVGFFLAQAATATPFFLPSFNGDLKLSANVASGQPAVSCNAGSGYPAVFSDPNRHPATPYLALIDPVAVRPFVVSSVAGDAILTAATNFSTAALRDSSIVSFLHLVRFTAPRLTINYVTDSVAEIEIEFLECSDEYLNATGETARKAFLYRFSSEVGGPWLMTSAENEKISVSSEQASKSPKFDIALVLDQTSGCNQSIPAGIQSASIRDAIEIIDMFADKIANICVVSYCNTAALVRAFTSDYAGTRLYLAKAIAGPGTEHSDFYFEEGDTPLNPKPILEAIDIALDELDAGASGNRRLVYLSTADSLYHPESVTAASLISRLNAADTYAYLAHGDGVDIDGGRTNEVLEDDIPETDHVIYSSIPPYLDDLPGPEQTDTFDPVQIEHGAMKTGLNLAEDTLELKVWAWKGSADFSEEFDEDFPTSQDHPAVGLLQGVSEAPLILEVFEVDADDPTLDGTLIFKGECSVTARGAELSIRCTPMGSRARRPLPWFLFQYGCNHTLFEPTTCGITIVSMACIGSVTAFDNTANYVDVETLSNSGGGKADNYFALGWLESRSGETLERRAILKSVGLGAGKQRCFINRPLRFAEDGSSIKLIPGCDKSYLGTNGCPKFGAGKEIRFGGFPAMPTENPTIQALPLQPGQNATK